MKKINSMIALIIWIAPVICTKASIYAPGSQGAQKKFFNIPERKIYVDVESQQLHLTNSFNNITASYKISTGKNGTGETPGSYKTPRGLFEIKTKIGENGDPMTKYKARIPVGMYHPAQSRYDNILSRILTLSGTQKHNLNTFRRYVYIHGTSAINRLGTKPCSLGCVRMSPYDIVSIFNQVKSGTPVYIYDKKNPLPWEKSISIHITKSPSLITSRKKQLNLSQAAQI